MNDTYVTFCGWVGSEVTLNDIGHDTQVASFRVGSTPRRFRGGQWQDDATAWHTVKAWRTLAHHVHSSIRQGDAVIVHGRLVADVWRKEDGTVSTRLVVVASSVGHDLSRGTSVFTKVSRREPADSLDESRVREVIHSYAEVGPTLDGNGEVVEEPATPEPAPKAGRVGAEPAA
jgi:single-strand DNA-binding protein